MTVNSKAMVGVPVFTRSGQTLGKVASLDFDAATGRLAAVRVKPAGLVQGVLAEDHLVAWDQVIELGPDTVVVADATVLAAATGSVPSLA